jgi:hypothetical protein
MRELMMPGVSAAQIQYNSPYNNQQLNLSAEEAKTLILGASLPYGDAVAKANFEKQYQHLKEKVIVMAPNSKHFIMFDQPTWFYEQLNAFLN